MKHAQDQFGLIKNFDASTLYFIFFKAAGEGWKLIQDGLTDEREAREFAEPLRERGQIRITKRVTTVLGGT